MIFRKKFVIIFIERNKDEKEKIMGKLYDKDSIESLDPLAFTRLRPGVYAGDTTYSTQLLVEIISNAVDEFRLGNGNEIKIIIVNHLLHANPRYFMNTVSKPNGKIMIRIITTIL